LLNFLPSIPQHEGMPRADRDPIRSSLHRCDIHYTSVLPLSFIYRVL
jgi:hypothetical protein